LEQENAELYSNAPYGFRPHCLSTDGVFRIGSNDRYMPMIEEQSDAGE
jgi:hypothetical protein